MEFQDRIMQYFFSPSHNPYYNLALEEYLLTSCTEDIMLCYINEPSLVIGRFQVPYRECDVEFLSEQNMPIVRRLSGGGSVYHDSGNLNYAFISTCDDAIGNYYDYYNQKTLEILKILGISNLSFERNNIFCHNKKISGVAQYKRKRRIVHHGTLLVDADLVALRNLFVNKDYYLTKGVVSVGSHVANISEFIPIKMEAVLNGFKKRCSEVLHLDFNTKIVEEKACYYASKEWVLGKSPQYKIEKDGLVIEVKDGIMINSSIPETVNKYHSISELKNLNTPAFELF